MSDDQARITVICDRNFKRDVKKAIANKDMDSFQDAYLQIFKLGLDQFKKQGTI